MNKLTYLLALLLIANLASAQIKESTEFEISLSQPFTTLTASAKYYILTSVGTVVQNGEAISIKIPGKTYSFEKFSGDKLNQTNSVNWIGNGGDTRYTIDGLIQLGDTHYGFVSSYDGETKKVALFATPLDFDEGTFSDDLQLIRSNDGKVKLIGDCPLSGPHQFLVIGSEDHETVIVQYKSLNEATRFDLSDGDSYTCIYDKNLELIWEGDITISLAEKEYFKTKSIQIMPSGDAYVFGKISAKKTEKNVLIYLKNDGTSVVLDDNLPEKMFSSKIIRGEDGKVYFVGFREYTGVDDGGIFIQSIEGAMLGAKINTSIPSKFWAEYTEFYTNDKELETYAKNRMGWFNLRNFSVLENGDKLLVGEVNYSRSNDNGTYIIFVEMVAMRVTADGELLWATKIPRSQSSRNQVVSCGTFQMMNDKSLYILTMDSPENKELVKTKFPEKYKDGDDGIITAYRINLEDGEMVRMQIADTKKVKGQHLTEILWAGMMEISPTSCAVEGKVNATQSVMLKIEFKE